jgi:hypothetical protein
MQDFQERLRRTFAAALAALPIAISLLAMAPAGAGAAQCVTGVCCNGASVLPYPVVCRIAAGPSALEE